MEVNQLTRREFLIRVFCEHKKGGFTTLMEALNHLSLQVIDANATALDGNMMNTFRVEVSWQWILISKNYFRWKK